MRITLAALAAVLLTAPAFATTYNVTNDTNLGTAMAAASAGDVVNIAAGSYTGSFVPSNSGTAGNYIRIVGSQASPATVATTAGLGWTEGSGSRSYVSWTGIKVGDDVSWFKADHCSLTYALVDSGGFRIFGTNTDPTSAGISENNYIADCTFRQNISTNSFAIVMKRTEHTSFVRCRFFQTITNAAADARGRYLYRSSNNSFTDCLLSVECWGAENGEQYIQGIRDSSANNVFLRDSIRVGMTSQRSRRCLLSQAGTFAGTATPNYWVSCDYRSWHETATDNAFEFQDGTGGGVYNCVFASRLGRPLTFPGSATTPGLVLRHVTAYSSSKQAFRYDHTTNPMTSHFSGMALAARSTGSCADNGSSLYKIQTLGAFATSDSNAFFAPDLAYTFQKAGGGLTCYALAAWTAATTNDAASMAAVLSGTVFADTAWATLDLRPASASSALKSASAPDGYYGAFDLTVTAPAECTCTGANLAAPAAVNDLVAVLTKKAVPNGL